MIGPRFPAPGADRPRDRTPQEQRSAVANEALRISRAPARSARINAAQVEEMAQMRQPARDLRQLGREVRQYAGENLPTPSVAEAPLGVILAAAAVSAMIPADGGFSLGQSCVLGAAGITGGAIVAALGMEAVAEPRLARAHAAALRDHENAEAHLEVAEGMAGLANDEGLSAQVARAREESAVTARILRRNPPME